MPEEILRVVRRLRAEGHEAYLVGGYVRDLLLGRPHKDCDVATSATPDVVEAIFPRSHPVGRRFGVILVVEGDTHIEVVTFRSEAEYVDGRRPSRVTYAGIEEDARRRDFTINALYYDPIEERIVDPLGVQDDLDARLIRTVGEPEERFAEDHLRLLRAVRLAAVLDFAIDPATRRSIRENGRLVTKVSAERVRDELAHCLADEHRSRALRLLDETGLLGHLLPELEACKGVDQDPKHHPEGDVFVHTMSVMEHLPSSAAFTLSLAALLHDVAKPQTLKREGDRIRFHGHEVLGADLAGKIGSRLRLSRAQREKLVWLVRHHLVFLQVEQMRRSTLRRYLAHEWFDALHALHRADCLGSHGNLKNWRIVDAARREFEEEAPHPPPLINGRDLLDLGLEPGPAFSEILREVETAQLEDQVADREEALALARNIAVERRLLPPHGGDD